MKYGDQTILKIEETDKKGRGCAMIGGRLACAPFAAPGEEVEVRCVGRARGELKMEVLRVVSPSPHRRTPPCPHALKCGGCASQHLDYVYQLELKRGLINRAFAAAGLPEIGAVEACPQEFRFRNRMDFCVGWRGEIGLKEAGRWNAYVDLADCRLISEDGVRALLAAKDWASANAVAPWDAKKHTGYLRYVVIREGVNTGKRMVTVVTSPGDLPDADGLLARLAPLATTVYHGVNSGISDLSTCESLTLLHGEEFLEECIAGRRFLIHPNAFFQTNTIMAERLVEEVRACLGEMRPASLLDLYCGTGLVGICLADAAERVVGVEIEPSAVEAARRNAELNGLENIRFESAKAEDLIWKDERPEAVVVDPPRVGLHPKVIATLLANRPPALIYVSCNYESFARDWQSLKEAYRLERCAAFDLFPHTPHVECVMLLKAKG
jgi:23S rRNA (uracil1939-C5)-methyltransferase